MIAKYKYKGPKEAITIHLLTGKSITPLEALDYYGTLRLASIIHRLRGEGMVIETERVPFTGKYGTAGEYARYTLAPNILASLGI